MKHRMHEPSKIIIRCRVPLKTYRQLKRLGADSPDVRISGGHAEFDAAITHEAYRRVKAEVRRRGTSLDRVLTACIEEHSYDTP